MKISYSEEAIKDLVRLREFIEIKNPLAAQRVSASIRQGITQLRDFPRLGIKVESAPDPDIVRDIIIGNYLSRYLITAQVIYVLRIWHHKEDIKI